MGLRKTPQKEAREIEKKKHEILKKGKYPVSIPYKSSGVGDIVIGSAVLGKTGALLGALNEGNTSWAPTELLFYDDRISVKSTGSVLLYDDIKRVYLGEKGFVYTIVTLVTKSGKSLIYRIASSYAEASKSIIEDHIVEDDNNESDILLKYAELYEKGLLTKEEFEIKKAELFSEKKESSKSDLADDTQEAQPNFCGDCGAPVQKGSKFCSNCGAKLI
ncbi:zinc-ribbon domain-containing protein [uncultured Methanobrevibacter sp.]|uniref:zinc-ribbon domain-containing protein n=1 Tax=uncultured Methanobrevibacter sp. TaxID=253161 RepID=UPI0026277529|nr:zinc-ribbon domain-containing protein [uncultured Methanobrevibacter sp.]